MKPILFGPIRWLLCKLGRHGRGKRTGISSELGVQYRCPHCAKHWSRRVYPRRKEKIV
jgi:transposase-like protein